ncbi:hypothetical protein L0Z65_04140 [Phaeobacter sp. BS52]|uniref:hypothetical protein n=1 Tax=Phaeobacter sp. BS52 TaxID=2907241 RepID=UPI003865230A
MTPNTIISQMSGRQFAKLLNREFSAANRGLGKLSYAELGRSCGVTGKWLRKLAEQQGTPSTLTIRLVLYTLGYEVDGPEEDVVPHLQGKDCYIDALHSPNRPRKQLTAKDIALSAESASART